MTSLQVTATFDKRWRVLWATSYTFDPVFFESFLLPRLGDPPLNATVLIDRHCLADAWQDLEATSPWRGSRANRDYLVRGVGPTQGAFHPKTYLVADERAGVLFVGSGNLGMNGMEVGKEVFSRFDSTDDDGLRAIRAWRSWMDGLVGRIGDDAVRARWNDARVRAPWLVGPVERSAFVSNWERPLLDQLLDGIATPADEVRVTAPFYDTDLGALSALIERTHPKRIVLLLGRDTSVDGPRLVRLLTESDAEIELLGLHPDTFVHAKLIAVTTGDRARLLSGSANLSGVALLRPAATDPGANVECGTLVDLSPAQARQAFDPPPPPDDLAVVARDEHQLDTFRLGEFTGVAFQIHLRSATWQPDGRIRVDVPEPRPDGAALSADHASAILDGSLTTSPFPDESARFVWISDRSRKQLSNKVAIDEPRALRAALEERADSDDDRPSGIEAADIETPVGQMLARLHATCIFDFDDTPSARRVAHAVEDTEDPDFWERLAREDLREDPRVARYAQLRHDLPRLDGVFLDLARMRDMVPGLPGLHVVGEQEEMGGEHRSGKRWTPERRLQVRLFNVLERWCGALTDPRLGWVDPLAPVANFAALAGALRECWALAYLAPHRVIELVGVLLTSFIRGERRPGHLATLDAEERAFVEQALSGSAAPGVAAGLAYAALRATQQGVLGYVFAWQPGVASGLDWGALRADHTAAECAAEVTGQRVKPGAIEERLRWAATYLDDEHWSDAVERDLGLPDVRLTADRYADGIRVVIRVGSDLDLVADRRVVELVRRALVYRKVAACVVHEGDDRLSVRLGDRLFAMVRGSMKDSGERLTSELLSAMAGDGAAFAQLFTSDDAAA